MHVVQRNELVKTVIAELRKKREEEPFQPTADIDVVWVLSLPGTVLTPSEDGIYQGRMADREIVNEGAKLVQKITAVRLQKDTSMITKEDIRQFGPLFLYNGEDVAHGLPQNDDLQRLIDRGEFPIPSKNVVIRNLAEMNTPGQVKDIAEFLTDHPSIQKVAVVARVHHQRRVARYLQHYKDRLPEGVTLVDASVPETQNNIGTTLREVRKIVRYHNAGHLTEKPYF